MCSNHNSSNNDSNTNHRCTHHNSSNNDSNKCIKLQCNNVYKNNLFSYVCLMNERETAKWSAYLWSLLTIK